MNFKRLGIETNGRTGGIIKTFCPKCRENRKDKRDKSLRVNLDKGIDHCYYCEENFNANVFPIAKQTHVPGGVPSRKREPSIQLPPPEHLDRPISEAHQEWFLHERKISAQALEALRVTSAEEYMVQTGKKEMCICFNYFDEEKYVNTKYRDLKKNFKMGKDAEVIPYHIDGIYHQPECIITEGEIVTITYLLPCGWAYIEHRDTEAQSFFLSIQSIEFKLCVFVSLCSTLPLAK